MKHIKNNCLYLGSDEEDIEKNLYKILRNIQVCFPLDKEKMGKLYENIEIDKENIYENNWNQDGKYIYQLHLLPNDDYRILEEIIQYVKENGTKKLKICLGKKKDKITKLKLINEYPNSRGSKITELDRKLHRWPEFIVENKKGINLHDIIISVYKLKRSKFSLNEYMYEINEFYLLNYATEHEITMVITFICGL
uniref:Uncharacterized protein n=1 Tax=Moumouvirus sp. 'Monve' TaxID=1128131 RepID=H2EFG1_9VIRU|nr:hypothetical protein mv_R1024 [Moumouvirus Monve]